MKKVILLSAFILTLASCSGPATTEETDACVVDTTACVMDSACVETCDTVAVADTIK